jgi:hypothetical protein
LQYIEPYYNWREFYIASEDENSPFHGQEHSDTVCTNTVYNYYIHPEWDEFGSRTLYLKLLYADYDKGFLIIELIGEWNDALYNDIMFLKRDFVEPMMAQGINKFILIGENVLNFHASDDCYYEEWFQDVEDGWITAVNFRPHVLTEFSKYNLDYYLVLGGELNEMNWRAFHPNDLFQKIETLITKRLN